MKKLPLLFLLAILLILPISAVGITYEKNDLGVSDMRVKVSDTILWGLIKTGEQGTLELKSHKNIKEIIDVIPGWDVNMIYETNFGELQNDILGKVYFYDLRTGKEVEKDYKFVYFGTEERSRDTYETICETNITSKNETQNCYSQINGTETYIYEGWLEYNSKDIPKGKITLGLMVDNKVNDYIDGVWEIAGKKIDKHAGWTASLETGLVSWYSLDETSGTTAFDKLGRNNGTNSGATINQTGKVNRSYKFDGTNDYVQYTGTSLSVDFPLTFNIWVNFGNSTSTRIIGGLFEGGSHYQRYGFIYDGTKIVARVYNGGVSDNTVLNKIPTTSQWYMLTQIVLSNGTQLSYLNGTYVGSVNNVPTAPSKTNSKFILGKFDSDEHYFNGLIDEVAIWNRTLTTDEIALLYNDGDGLGYKQTFGNVTSLSPINNFNSSSNSVTFIGNTTQTNVTNFSLIINNTYEQTNTSGLSGNYTFTETLDDGVYSWKFEGCTASECLNSTARTLTIDTTIPTITASLNETILYAEGDKILLNTTVTDTNLDKVWYNYNGTNTTITGAKTGTLNQTTITTTLTQLGIIVYANDTAGNLATPVTLNLTLDTTPPTINITSPVTNYNYLYPNATIDLNYTITDTNLDKCWYGYNGTNTTLNCSLNTTFNYIPNINTLTVYANDTVGNEGSLVRNWNYHIFKEYEDYDDSVLEGSSTTFKLGILTNGSAITLSNLSYDGVGYLGSISNVGNNYTITRTITAPIVNADTNKTFFWKLSSGLVLELEERNQTVLNFGVDNCSTNTFLLYNFSLYDEKTQVLIPSTSNITGEIDIKIYSSDNLEVNIFSKDYSSTFFPVCISNNLSLGENYYADVQIKYGAIGYATEFYNIQKTAIFSSNLGQDISLYDLDNDTAKVFTINYRDASFLPVKDALIIIQRKYIDEGVFKVVEAPLTDNNGDALAHLEEVNVVYNFIVSKDGINLATFTNQRVKCQNALLGACDIAFNSYSTAVNPVNYSGSGGVSYTITYSNSTKLVTTTFNVQDGTASTILLNVTLFNSSSSNLCSNSLTSNSGTLECTIPAGNNKGTALIRIYRDGEFIGQAIVKLGVESNKSIFGGSLIFISIFMFLTLFGIGISSDPTVMGIFLIIGAVIGVLLNVTNSTGFIGPSATILWLIIAIVLVVIKGGNRQ